MEVRNGRWEDHIDNELSHDTICFARNGGGWIYSLQLASARQPYDNDVDVSEDDISA